MKKYLLILLFSIFALNGFSQNAIINGTITYFFNDYQGDKPDIGSKVLVFPSTLINTKPLFDSLVKMEVLLNISDNLKSIISSKKFRLKELSKHKKRNLEEITKYEREILEDSVNYLSNLKLIKSNKYDDESKIHDMDSRFSKSLFEIEYDENSHLIKKTTVDGTGRFSIKVNPGEYYILIKSNNRKGLMMSNVLGKCYLEQIKINANEEISVDHKFDINSFD